jgi:DNA-binding transcriptional MocR family regulator
MSIKTTFEETRGTRYRYAMLADTIESQIRDGTFRAGDKLPSIRGLHARTGLSISTVYQAFIELEKRGMILAREKSGYYVKPLLERILPSPVAADQKPVPRKVTINNLAATLFDAMVTPDVLPLGGAFISESLLPLKELSGLLKSAPQSELNHNIATYGHYLGHFGLRRKISQRLAPVCGNVSPEQMVITNGCMEAVSLCLQAVTEPGDTVIVESPTFPWFLQVIEDLNLYALEIPTDCRTGINLPALERALKSHSVKACIFVSTFNNPMGFTTAEKKKEQLVRLLNSKGIPIIEDDIYGELHFDTMRPSPLKHFDKKEMVLYCSSFSKCLSPGLRVGWAMAGRYHERVQRLKLNHSIGQPPVTQWLAYHYLQTRSFDRHLRKLRTCLKHQISNTAQAIARYFPSNTKISAPQGGVALWIQLDDRVDSLELFRRALEAKVAVMPGIMCASGDAFKNCIRICCGIPYDDRIELGIQILGRLIKEMT